MAHLKRSIVEMKAEENCLVHAFIIAIAKVEKDSNYDAFRKGCKIHHIVQTLLETIVINLSDGAGITEVVRFQEHIREYKIVVYHGLKCDNITFEWQVDSAKRLNLLYDDVEKHYHVITNLTGAMARRHVCKGRNNSCTSDVKHVCDRTVPTAWPPSPCTFSDVRFPCAECNRHFRSRTSYENHRQRTLNKKSVCECRWCCATNVTSDFARTVIGRETWITRAI